MINAFKASTRRWPSVALRLHASSFSANPPAPEKEQLIHDKLVERFSPSRITITDVSGGCGTFFAISIASKAFNGISMVKQHQLVTQTLKSEIEEIHGLQIKTYTE